MRCGYAKVDDAESVTRKKMLQENGFAVGYLAGGTR
jgi:hypothetical protein